MHLRTRGRRISYKSKYTYKKSALEKGTHSKKEVRLRVVRRKGSMKRIADVIEGMHRQEDDVYERVVCPDRPLLLPHDFLQARGENNRIVKTNLEHREDRHER